MKDHRGTMLLVFGILGIVACPIFAIVAWVMGKGDLKEIAAGRMDPAGESNTRTGMILGIVGTILLAVGVLIWAALLMFVLVAGDGQFEMPK